MRRFLPLVVLLSSGCIWNPTDRTDHEKDSSLLLQGVIGQPGTPVRIEARNYDTGARVVVPITPTSGASTIWPGHSAYFWSTTIPASLLYSELWAPSDLGPLSVGASSPGRLELQAFAGNQDIVPLATFTRPAKECFDRKVRDEGLTPGQASLACFSDEVLVQFDQTGIDEGADPNRWRNPSAGSGSNATIRWDVVRYVSQGLDVFGLVCRPRGGGPRPVHIYNHGGAIGLIPEDFELCKLWASWGWVMAMSVYRGERLFTPEGFIHEPDPDGRIETCLGEVTDVMRLMEMLPLMAGNADMSRVLMTGGSHGGCITARAVERGARVKAAVNLWGASDWGLTHDECVSPPERPDFCDLARATIEASTGGLPADRQLAYAWRSPKYHDDESRLFAGDLAQRTDVKLLIMQGVEDTIVRPKQSCMLAREAWGTDFLAWHVDTKGAETDAPVPECDVTWETPGAPGRPTTDWPENRYLIMYDGLTHGGGVSAHFFADYFRFVHSLGWSATP